MKKIYIITCVVVVMLVSFLGITYSYEYNDDNGFSFDFIGPSVLYVDVNSKYQEYGIKVRYNGRDVSKDVIIDSSSVNTQVLGEYNVKYSVKNDEYEEYVYRKVVVIDMSAPVINLIGSTDISILQNGSYYEYGYKVTDNCDNNLDDKVIITNNIDTSKEGEYTVKYSISDSSGNTSYATRNVKVVKASIKLSGDVSGAVDDKFNVLNYDNTIYYNKFVDNGIYFEGYSKDNSNVYRIKLKNSNTKREYLYNMSLSKSNYYKGVIDISTLPNGTYLLYIVGNNEKRLVNKLSSYSRLVRSKIGGKLVTFNYDNDLVSIIISDFKYEYDIAIDVGHGGVDTGASNGIIFEKDLNLKQSLYEKCRYEEMGYKVYLVRTDDSYGEMLGDNDLELLNRRALTIGYYGVVSRVSYSNHHNGSGDSSIHGYEIIVGNQRNNTSLLLEKDLYNKLYSVYDGNISMYSKDYDSEIAYNKVNGNVYDTRNYYAVIRIPYELFNVNNVIYEPIYMSNISDFNWYYTNNNWINVTEIKIMEYVNYLGGTYNKDNSKCLIY